MATIKRQAKVRISRLINASTWWQCTGRSPYHSHWLICHSLTLRFRCFVGHTLRPTRFIIASRCLSNISLLENRRIVSKRLKELVYLKFTWQSPSSKWYPPQRCTRNLRPPPWFLRTLAHFPHTTESSQPTSPECIWTVWSWKGFSVLGPGKCGGGGWDAENIG